MALMKKNKKKENVKKEPIKVEKTVQEGETEVKVQEKKKIIKKGSKVIANGRCFGAPSLECPLKTVRNYETKILDTNSQYNSVLIDTGWINKYFVK